MLRPAHAALLCLFTTFIILPANAQFGLGNKTKVSDKAPELSDNDKKKMAEIEQRPDVQEEVRNTWDSIRRKDLQYAFAVNASLRYAGGGSVKQAIEFRESYGELYDSPILQRYMNNIGQRLVPKDSPNVYSFRLLLDPVPRAEALSTGSVYVSTGLVALLDNEAQLSYVLAHEVAHIEKNHHYSEVRNSIVEMKFNEDKIRDAERRKGILTAVTTVAGAAIGGAAKGGLLGIAGGGLLGNLAGSIAGALLFRTNTTVTEWSEVNENEADEAALTYMLNQNYDAREIPRLFARMSSLTARDSRVGLGFIARPDRVRLRTSHMQQLLAGASKATIEAKVKGGGLVASTPEFPLIMSSLKRDNGIMALEYDLFAESRDNLEEAVSLRSNDARAQLYLGKVISMTARTADDRQQGMDHFLKAIKYDEARGAYPDPHLERAIDMIAQNNPQQQDEIRKELQVYVALYQRENRGALPANMPILYDYMQLAGDTSWYVAPNLIISTKDGEPLHVIQTTRTTPLTPTEISQAATLPSPSSMPLSSTSSPAQDKSVTPKAKKVAATTK